MRIIALLVVEEELGERARQLGLADAGWAQEDEAAERTIGVLQAGPRAADRVRDGLNGLVLADDALVQPLLHVDELLDLALHQPADRDVRPLADDFGDVFLVDLFLQHAPAPAWPRPRGALPRRASCCSSSGRRPYCSSDALP